MKFITLLWLACLGVLGASAGWAAGYDPVPVGEVLREATMTGLNGPPKRLADYRGKPLVINVWASWCAPCRQEMGSLQRLHQRFGQRGFTVIGISTDDYPQKAKEFLARSKTGFPNYIDHELMLERMLGADRLPLTLLIDARGKVLARYYGAREWDSPEALAVIGKAFGIDL